MLVMMVRLLRGVILLPASQMNSLGKSLIRLLSQYFLLSGVVFIEIEAFNMSWYLLIISQWSGLGFCASAVVFTSVVVVCVVWRADGALFRLCSGWAVLDDQESVQVEHALSPERAVTGTGIGARLKGDQKGLGQKSSDHIGNIPFTLWYLWIRIKKHV